MKSLLKKFICIALAALTLFAVACDCIGKNNTVPPAPEKVVIPETDTYLLEKGKTDYVIVIPANSKEKERAASEELVLFFKEATGLTLPVTFDSNVTYTDTAKLISLGNTSFALEKGIVPTYQTAGENGFVIKTVGYTVFIAGYTDFGTLFGVYEFLNYEFDYDFYTRDSYTLNSVKQDVRTKKYDVLKKPDINTMQSSYGYIINDEVTANRYQMMHRRDIFLYINDVGSVHNSIYFLPTADYQENHPDYYYPAQGQDDPKLQFDLCFTAHGNAQEFENMTTDVTNEIIEEFKSGAVGTIMVLGQRDINKTCECDACLKVTNDYGSASAKGIIFCNRVLEKVYAWFETDEGKPYAREFYFMLLAYEKFVSAPVTKQSDGSYTVNNGLEIHPRFGAMHAPIGFNFTVPKEDNLLAYDAFYQWGAIANALALYAYDTNFQSFFVPFNSFEAKKGIYDTMKELKCISIFEAGQGQDGVAFLPSVWSMLKAYLESKLRWDTAIDINYYTQKYFYGVYGEEAGETMYNTYLSFRAYWKDLELRRKAGESIMISDFMGGMELPSLWSLQILQNWYGNMELAREQVEPLKQTDPDRYEVVCNMISVERASVVYLLVSLYADYFSDSELYQLKLQFKADMAITKTPYIGPASKPISGLLASWGV